MEVDAVGNGGDTTEDEETSSEIEDNVTPSNTTPALAAASNGSVAQLKDNGAANEDEPAPPKPKPTIRIKLKLPKMSASGLPVPARKAQPTSTDSAQSTEKPLIARSASLPLAQKAASRKLPMSSSAAAATPSAPKRKRSISPRPGLPMAAAATSAASSPSNSPRPENEKILMEDGTKPKSRIRSLKLPMTNKPPPADDGEMEVLQATVVNSDDDASGEAVAAVVASSSAVVGAQASPKTSAGGGSTATKRKNPIKIRIPPLLSPGLRVAGAVPPPSVPNNNASFVGGTPTTAAEVFDQAMAAAGYTVEARTQRPHRGSSTTRVVGDMFDSNVKLAVHFPPLVPLNLWEFCEEEEEESLTESPSTNMDPEATASPLTNGESNRKTKGPLVRERLLDELASARSSVCDSRMDDSNSSSSPRRNGKRPRPWDYREFLPVSLSIPFAESYINDQLAYVKLVQEREKAILRKQDAEEREQFQDSEQGAAAQVVVPPIPPLPTPPVMKDVPGFIEKYQDQHPYYLPKSNPSFVAHLDSKCFHVSEGRYFGLLSNNLADPNFVGANAPGIAGLSAAGGAGLATSLSGGATATSLTLSSTFQGTQSSLSTDLIAPSLPEVPSVAESVPVAAKKSALPDSKPPAAKKLPESTNDSSTLTQPEGPPKKKKKASSAPAPTASTSSLRKVMGEGGEVAEKTRQKIIRSAVFASRSGSHGGAFQLGEKIYPDVGKAFAQHAGIKPCLRCKNNKQGAYHCRLRRKHAENDFDGGTSANEIQPLFHVPLDKLMEEDDETE